MPTTEPFALDTDRGPLHGIAHLADRRGARPTVVVCHGFKGFMEWGFFPSVAELLAQRGFTAIRFNFLGSGMLPGDQLVTNVEAFRRANFGGDAEDLRQVLAAAGTEIAPGRVDRQRIGLFGHSRGGGVALLTAAETRSVGALVTWAGVSTFDRLGDEANRTWRADGEVPVVNARTGQTLPVSVEVLQELEANTVRFDLEAAARRRQAPWLIVHGEEDPTVPVAEAELLSAAATGASGASAATAATAARPPSRLLRIAGADHTFGAKHPFAGPTPMLIEAMNATQSWFRQYLGSEDAPLIVREDRGDVAVLRLEHGRVNAIDIELLEALSEQAAGWRAAPPRAVVITGTGSSFSAGLDLVRALDEGPDYFRRLLPALNQALLDLFTLPRPVIAAVNGHAIAGGFILACACDYRIMARGTGRLGVTELPVGVPFPSVPLELVRTVAGTRLARELTFSGRLLSADQGDAMGLVDQLARPENLLERSLETAARWGASPFAAFELTKWQLQQPVVDRLAEQGPGVDAEVLEVWTAPETHAAIRGFVDRTLGKSS